MVMFALPITVTVAETLHDCTVTVAVPPLVAGQPDTSVALVSV
jgi:hypothetical protein